MQAIQKAVDALAGLVENEGGPRPEHFAKGREVLAELREVLNPSPEEVAKVEKLLAETGGGDHGNA